MGVGGGFVMVPAMIYLLRMPTRMVIGTSTFQIVCMTAFTTVLQAMQNHSVDVLLSLPLILGGVVGAQYGVGFAERLKAEQLRARPGAAGAGGGGAHGDGAGGAPRRRVLHRGADGGVRGCMCRSRIFASRIPG